jgi:hypothetical protein
MRPERSIDELIELLMIVAMAVVGVVLLLGP